MANYNLEKLFNDLSKKKLLIKISYTSSLLAEKIFSKKNKWESIELILEFINNNKNNVIKESADLLYHLCVMISVDVKPADVWNELQKRKGTSGLDEKKSKTVMVYNNKIYLQIIDKKLKTEIIVENEHALAFKDIAPQAPNIS